MRSKIVGAALLCSLPFVAHAADHIDAPAATAEPNADITDVYAWMNADASKLNLVLDVHHMAGADSAFSTAVQYAVHLSSAASFGADGSEAVMMCQFYTAAKLECWLGDEYLEGDPSDPTGITSASGKLKVFAGRRDDPFFFELTGFKETVKAVKAAAGSLTFDTEGCPALDADTSAALVGQLQHGAEGAAASNTFAGSSVLSFAVQIDKSLVTEGGPIVGVWASTHAAN
jgi:hypothetical protein